MSKVPVPSVPRLWPESTVVCLGTGPSLTQADVDYCRGRARVIAVNDAYRLAPWADVLYACDGKWWYWHGTKERAAIEQIPLRFALDPAARSCKGVQVLQKTGETGLELKPTGLRAGRNSGYQAINLAVHLGAKRILLLGYDMRGDHFFGHHPDQSKPPFSICLQRFATLLAPLKAIGVEVINCSRRTDLQSFPRAALRDVLGDREDDGHVQETAAAAEGALS